MGYTSNTLIIRRDLLKHIVRLFADGKLVEEIDRIPIQMAPKRREAQHRCCIHKERAVIKYKLFPLLGYTVDDEKDELTPLSFYAENAQNRTQVKQEIMTVVDESLYQLCKSPVRSK